MDLFIELLKVFRFTILRVGFCMFLYGFMGRFWLPKGRVSFKTCPGACYGHRLPGDRKARFVSVNNYMD